MNTQADSNLSHRLHVFPEPVQPLNQSLTVHFVSLFRPRSRPRVPRVFRLVFTMRILITGICGFVGSTLARGLREGWPDWEIVGLDNLVRAGSETNRRALRERGIKLYHGDVRNPSDLETLPRCDWIIEAAANPSVLAGVDGKTSSRQLIEHNLVGTINMLELLKHWRCGFTILSTSRVYSIRALAAIPVETQGDRFVPALMRPDTPTLAETTAPRLIHASPPRLQPEGRRRGILDRAPVVALRQLQARLGTPRVRVC